MADAEVEAAARPEVPRVVSALRARLWQLQAELREQEVSEASSRAYCRGFCQVGAGCGGPRRGLRAGCGQRRMRPGQARGCLPGRSLFRSWRCAGLPAPCPAAERGCARPAEGAPWALCRQPGAEAEGTARLWALASVWTGTSWGPRVGLWGRGPHRIFSVQFWLGSETSGCLCFTCLGIRSAYSSCLRSAVGCKECLLACRGL